MRQAAGRLGGGQNRRKPAACPIASSQPRAAAHRRHLQRAACTVSGAALRQRRAAAPAPEGNSNARQGGGQVAAVGAGGGATWLISGFGVLGAEHSGASQRTGPSVNGERGVRSGSARQLGTNGHIVPALLPMLKSRAGNAARLEQGQRAMPRPPSVAAAYKPSAAPPAPRGRNSFPRLRGSSLS
jgi:hypothetical protein